MTGTWASGWATGDIVTAAEFKKTAGSIFDTTLGASAATIDITGISATYAHLLVTIYARADTASTNTTMLMAFNGDVAANYDYQLMQGNGSTASAAETFAANFGLLGSCPAATAGANLFGATEVFIPHYAGSANNKEYIALNGYKLATTTGQMNIQMFAGGWRSTAAINRITLFGTSANFVAGTRLSIHALGA